ncbi:MAG TPA: peptidylprolyl isomerase [Anaerolineae bacterium]|nr:peptidylprolyl isomerase [Anaerolineae bacterium]
MDSRLSRWCDGLIEAGWLIAVMAIPLFFNIHSDRVFEPDKLTLLRSLALLMSTAWLTKFVDQEGWSQLSKWRWRDENSSWRKPFILPVFLLVVVYVVSTFFSVTQQVSWAGSYQRLQGTYTTLSYIVIFALMIDTIRTQAQIQRVITIVIITSIPVSLYALLQRLGHDPLPWGGNVQRRVAGHMGNAIFIAAYLIMALPLTVTRIIDAFSNILEDEELSYADLIRSSIYIFTLAIQLIAIYWSRSRGPWLGLAVGMFAFVLILLVNLRLAASQDRARFGLTDILKAVGLVAIGSGLITFVLRIALVPVVNSGRFESLTETMSSFVAFAGSAAVLIVIMFVLVAARRGWHWLWLSWISLGVLLGGWLVLFNVADQFIDQYEDTPVVGSLLVELNEWRTLPSIGRLGRILEADASTGRVRVLIWEGVLDLISIHEPVAYPNGETDPFNVLRPLVGYGPESMYVAYNRFYPPELATVEARNASPDRAHNETFDALAITGVLGFVFWQWLYLSVFYYGFRWLGAVRSRQDTIVFMTLWFGGAIITTIFFVQWMGPVFFGVSLPFGSIGGLVLYLIYYAIYTRPETLGLNVPFADDEETDEAERFNPFSVNRLTMIALVSAVAAHYIEIHFGIAIAATRLHFFTYLGLIFLLGYVFEIKTIGVDEEDEEDEEETASSSQRSSGRRRGRRTGRRGGAPEWLGPLLGAGMMMMLLIALLSFNFVNFATRPGEQFASVQDLPTQFEFVQRSFLENKGEASPYVFMMIILSWGFGLVLYLAEMVKSNLLSFGANMSKLDENRKNMAMGGYALLGVLSVGAIFLFPSTPETAVVSSVARLLLISWAILCLWAALSLYFNYESAQVVGGAVAAVGFSMSLVLFLTGSSLYGIGLLLVSLGLFYLLWDDQWIGSLVPTMGVAVSSLGLGFVYAWFQSNAVRNSIIATAAMEVLPEVERRIAEADRGAAILTQFYVFIGIFLLVMAFVLWISQRQQPRQGGQPAAFVAFIVLFMAGAFLVTTTNLRIIQADIVYKRARPWEQQASRARDAAMWDNAIGIYEHALELAPDEDFYYLFLGRAYLEQSSLIGDENQRNELLEEAERRLKRAQEINPLNTDHTANLARLNVRWAQFVQGDERKERYELAKEYYVDALKLSPQNSIIRNEYASIAITLGNDCELSLAVFDESVEVDPYYDQTYFRRADAYTQCAQEVETAEQDFYYGQALESLQGAREVSGESEYWRVDFLTAQAYLRLDEQEMAIEAAEQSLETAPAEQKGQIEGFINNVRAAEQGAEAIESGNVVEVDGGNERPLAQIEPAARNNIFNAPPPMVIDTSLNYQAVIKTNKGRMQIQLFTEQAPMTVNNFIYLAQQGFYDGTTFHRVIEDFMAQGGDPTGTGTGGPGYRFEDEVDNGLAFDRRGLLAMANSGPNTNGSQFFITFAPTPWLDGNHTIFGELVMGDDVLSDITIREPSSGVESDVIEKIEIVVVAE